MIKIFKTEEEWLAEKDMKIGGTAISSVLGLNQYQTPIQLYRKLKKLDPPVEMNDNMRLGILLEPFVIKYFTDDYPECKNLYPKEEGIVVFTHPEYDFLISSPDAVLEMDGHEGLGIYVDEAKTTKKYISDHTDISNSWICQLNWNIGLGRLNGLDIKGGYFSVFSFPTGNIQTFPYDFNQELFDVQLSSGIEFMDMVAHDIVPEESTIEDFNFSPYEPDSVIYASNRILQILQEYKEAKDAGKAIKDKEVSLGLQIRKYMGAKQIMLLENGDKVVSFSHSTKNRFNTQKFKEENPELYEKYIEKTYSRELRPVYTKL